MISYLYSSPHKYLVLLGAAAELGAAAHVEASSSLSYVWIQSRSWNLMNTPLNFIPNLHLLFQLPLNFWDCVYMKMPAPHTDQLSRLGQSQFACWEYCFQTSSAALPFCEQWTLQVHCRPFQCKIGSCHEHWVQVQPDYWLFKAFSCLGHLAAGNLH